MDLLQPCVTFNKQNTYQWFAEHTAPLPDDHDPADQVQAFAQACEDEPLRLGIFYRQDKPVFEEQLEAYADDARPLYERQLDLDRLAATMRAMGWAPGRPAPVKNRTLRPWRRGKPWRSKSAAPAAPRAKKTLKIVEAAIAAKGVAAKVSKVQDFRGICPTGGVHHPEEAGGGGRAGQVHRPGAQAAGSGRVDRLTGQAQVQRMRR